MKKSEYHQIIDRVLKPKLVELLGASAEESEDPEVYWVFQIDKHRTLKEKLLGRENMSEDDECLKYFRSLIESESGFNNVVPA
jgi:hypothetical protein